MTESQSGSPYILKSRFAYYWNQWSPAASRASSVKSEIDQYDSDYSLKKSLLASVDVHNDEGNKFAEAGDYVQALACYIKALKTPLEDSFTESQVLRHEYKNSRITHLGNIAHWQIKLGDYRSAKSSWELALKGNTKNSKIHYRLALSNAGLKNYRESMQSINEAILLDPKNSFLKVEKDRIKSELKQHNQQPTERDLKPVEGEQIDFDIEMVIEQEIDQAQYTGIQAFKDLVINYKLTIASGMIWVIIGGSYVLLKNKPELFNIRY